MTPAERKILLLMADLLLAIAAVQKTDRFGMAVTRPELCSARTKAAIEVRDRLERELYAAREEIS